MSLMTQLDSCIRFKMCSGCKNVRPLDDYYRGRRGLHGRTARCKSCISAYKKLRNAEPGQKFRNKENWISRYGLTVTDLDYMIEAQDGKCAICGTTEPGGRHNSWHVDHDHACCPPQRSCGKCIRGLLCFRCNSAIGYMKDDPEVLEAAANYIRGSQTHFLTLGVARG